VLEQSAGSNTGLFYFMCLVRKVEESLLKLFSEGKLSGTTHTCIGQESIAGALWATLRPDDIVFSSHRCHGHFLARGGKLKDLFAEIMGRNAAICGGRGGGQHLHYGNFYSNGIQGGVVGNATGIALAEKLKGAKVPPLPSWETGRWARDWSTNHSILHLEISAHPLSS
jgi:2-oxoisovalerate dehydrogenase E1 component